MTLDLMKEWGVESEVSSNTFRVSPGGYSPIDFKVEADWSAASYWFEAAAFSFGDIKLDGLMKKAVRATVV